MAKIIQASNVSKKYLIYHQNQGYGTLVDTLSRKARQCFQKATHPFKKSHYRVNEFEEFWALQNINLEIEEGDRVGIIGRNGAGKSTLLKIFARITEPTTGKIKIRGKVASLLEVGTGFHPELTGRENIFLNGAILGMKRQEIKQKFDEIVAFSEVEKFLDTPVKRFSSGMYTRLGFGIAAYLDPDVLIVDEVLSVGDMQFQQKCLKKLRDLSSAGRTVIFVSHDVGSVLSLCNKGVFLEKGNIKEWGPIDQCINSYMRSCRFHTLSWEGNAGDSNMRIRRAALTSPGGNREFFYQNEQTELKIDYELLKPSPEHILGVGVWNQRNQLLAYTSLSEVDEQLPPFDKLGHHRASLLIDAGLFHEGEYLIKVDCSFHTKRILNDEIILKFPVYKNQKNIRLQHSENKIEGISLGNKWKFSAAGTQK